MGAAAVVPALPRPDQVWLSALVCLAWVLLLGHPPGGARPVRVVQQPPYRHVVRAGAVLLVGAAATGYVVPTSPPPVQLLATVAATVAAALLAVVVTHRAPASPLRVVVAGHHGEVGTVISELCRADVPHIEVTAVTVAETRDEVVASVSRHRADALLITPCTHFDPGELRRTGWDLEAVGAELLVHPGLVDVAEHRVSAARWGSLHVVHVAQPRATGIPAAAKALAERAAATLALALVAPVLLLLMLAVRLDSRGPAVFRQQRVGRDGSLFTMYKLRTMTTDAEARRDALVGCNEADGALFKIRCDPRVTRLGGFLRRYSLDELPQLVNVARGHMALIGPRPALPAEVAQYDLDARRRLAVKPGLTGLWQVSGRSDLPWAEALRLDLDYVDNWSPGMDVTILRRTARAVLGHHGAY